MRRRLALMLLVVILLADTEGNRVALYPIK
jgi:hypothetical protein